MPKPKLNPDDARQGEKGTSVLLILVVALALCAVIFVGLGVYGWWLPDAEPGMEGVSTEIAPPVEPVDPAGIVVAPE